MPVVGGIIFIKFLGNGFFRVYKRYMTAEYQQSNSTAKGAALNPSMFWTIEYVNDQHFVRVVATGIYNIDDHMRMLEDIATHDFWKPGMNWLLDESNLSYHGSTLEQLREAGARRVKMDDLIGRGKTAVVMNTLSDFMRARQYELITSGKVSAKIEIFKDEEKAVNWLLA
jgi:hypothetical protein